MKSNRYEYIGKPYQPSLNEENATVDVAKSMILGLIIFVVILTLIVVW